MQTHKQKIGQIGEQIAENYLKNNKFRIIGRNYRKPWGEIDLIARKGESLHFVEVKTQMADFVNRPDHKVDWRKQKRIQRAALTYLSEKRCPLDQEWQIDVIAIELTPDLGVWEIRYVERI
jgi:putative endonuclease